MAIAVRQLYTTSPGSRKPIKTNVKTMAGVEGLEPPTCWFEARRSIQLSYTPTALIVDLRAGPGNARASRASEGMSGRPRSCCRYPSAIYYESFGGIAGVLT